MNEVGEGGSGSHALAPLQSNHGGIDFRLRPERAWRNRESPFRMGIVLQEHRKRPVGVILRFGDDPFRHFFLDHDRDVADLREKYNDSLKEMSRDVVSQIALKVKCT